MVPSGDQSLAVGARVELTIADSGGLALSQYVSQLVEKTVRTGVWRLEFWQGISVGGNSAERVEYRFGGTNRCGQAVFVERKGKVYTWRLITGGSTCGEESAFGGIVASFRLVE